MSRNGDDDSVAAGRQHQRNCPSLCVNDCCGSGGWMDGAIVMRSD